MGSPLNDGAFAGRGRGFTAGRGRGIKRKARHKSASTRHWLARVALGVHAAYQNQACNCIGC